MLNTEQNAKGPQQNTKSTSEFLDTIYNQVMLYKWKAGLPLEL